MDAFQHNTPLNAAFGLHNNDHSISVGAPNEGHTVQTPHKHHPLAHFINVSESSPMSSATHQAPSCGCRLLASKLRVISEGMNETSPHKGGL